MNLTEFKATLKKTKNIVVVGPISPQILRHNSEIREAHLMDSKGISRTFALTFFQKKVANKEIERVTYSKKERQGGLLPSVSFSAATG